MKASTSLALFVSALAITAVNGGALLNSILRPRGYDEVWGGVNITYSVLEVYNAISHPTCNATDYCVQLATTVVPKCLQLQGAAGCWCTLHDPIHYCAICMSSPTDNTTTPDQTQAATEGHANYHKGCAAWQAYINASAAGSLTTSSPPTTSAPLPTLTPEAQTTENNRSTVSGGAIAGIVIGGVAFLAVVGAATYLISRCLKNQADRDARQAELAAANEKRNTAMAGFYNNTDMGDRIPNTPPPQMPPYLNQPMLVPGSIPNQGQHHPQPQPNSPHSAYSGGVQLPGNMGARPDSMFTEATAQSGPYQSMRQGSMQDIGGSQPGQPMTQPGQMGQYHVTNDLGPQRNVLGSPPPPFSQHPQG